MRRPLIVFQNFHLLCEIYALLHGYCKNVAHSYYWSNFLANVSRYFFFFKYPLATVPGCIQNPLANGYWQPSGKCPRSALATLSKWLNESLFCRIQQHLLIYNQRIGIKIEANANLYVVGITTYWRILWQFLYLTPTDPPPPPAKTNIGRKRDFYYTVIWEAAEKLMALVWFFLEGGGIQINACRGIHH
jgi:hypothetical protein